MSFLFCVCELIQFNFFVFFFLNCVLLIYVLICKCISLNVFVVNLFFRFVVWIKFLFFTDTKKNPKKIGQK